MPIYEYKCPQCNDVFEEWVKSYAETAACPKCQTTAMQIISNTSFVLKGGGWYVTEYGNRKNVVDDSSESSQSANTSPTDSTASPNSEQKTDKNESTKADNSGQDSSKTSVATAKEAKKDNVASKPATSAETKSAV